LGFLLKDLILRSSRGLRLEGGFSGRWRRLVLRDASKLAPQDEAVKAFRNEVEEAVSDKALRIEDAINETCPWLGKPIAADSLTLYRGEVVGFCNPGCRDKFEAAIRHFEKALADRDVPLIAKGIE
jgi:hypothetical protein